MNGHFVKVSRALAALAGLKPADLIGKTDADLFDAYFFEESLREERDLAANGGQLTRLIEANTRSGPQKRLVTKTRVLDDEGRPSCIVGISKSVSELISSYELLNVIFDFDRAPVNIFIKDSSLRYENCNEAFARIHGRSRSEINGKTDFELWPGPENTKAADEFRRIDNLVLTSNRPCGPFEETLPSGQIIETCKFPLRDASGNAVRVLGVYYDVTERVLERKGREAAEVAARVGHCFKDHSFYFQNELDALGDTFPEVRSREEFRRVSRGARYLAEMTDLVRQMPLSERLRATAYNPIPVIVETADMINDKRLKIEYSEADCQVSGARHALKTAILALLDNASRYADKLIGIRVDIVDGAFRLHIWDDGPGIEPSDSLFQFKFVMKGSDLRAGFGLPWAWEVSRFHGGVIELVPTGTDGIESRSHLRISLPLSRTKGDQRNAE